MDIVHRGDSTIRNFDRFLLSKRERESRNLDNRVSLSTLALFPPYFQKP